jgi:hypothetical protein
MKIASFAFAEDHEKASQSQPYPRRHSGRGRLEMNKEGKWMSEGDCVSIAMGFEGKGHTHGSR